MNRIFFTVLLAILSVSMPACALKKQQQQFAGMDGDFVNGTPLPDRVEGSNFFGNQVQRGQFPSIYFGFDAFTVSSSEQTKVRELAAALKGMRNTVVIAGFTDSRGTEEYNRALGERRAHAVRQALIALGCDGNRIQTVSFGMEMPADSGEGESAWAKNRRAEIGVVK